jgi:putative peptidoglycan lipid II flippase
MASRVLGLARDVLYAGLFGAGDVMDAFTVAFRIPNLLRDLFAEGAMSAAFVPAFTRALNNEGREAAWARPADHQPAVVVTGVERWASFAEPLLTRATTRPCLAS